MKAPDIAHGMCLSLQTRYGSTEQSWTSVFQLISSRGFICLVSSFPFFYLLSNSSYLNSTCLNFLLCPMYLYFLYLPGSSFLYVWCSWCSQVISLWNILHSLLGLGSYYSSFKIHLKWHSLVRDFLKEHM